MSTPTERPDPLKVVKEKTDVDLKFLTTAFSVINGSKEGNLTYDDIAYAIVKQGVAPRFIEALGTALRLKEGNHS